MKVKICILSIIISYSFSACKTTNKNETEDLLKITPDISYYPTDNIKPIPIKEFVDTITYIPLTLSGDNLLGKVTHIFPLTKNTILADLTLAKAIFVFDEKGNFKSKISKGVGSPDEPESIDGICVDLKASEFFIYSGSQAKVFSYNEDGKLKSIISVPNGYFGNIQKVKNGFLFYRELEADQVEDPLGNFRLCLIDDRGNFVKGWYPGPRNKMFQLPSPQLYFRHYLNSDDFIFESPGMDTLLLYSSAKNEIKPIFHLDFGSKNKSIQKDLLLVRSIDQYFNVSNASASLQDIPLSTSEYIIGSYRLKGSIYDYVYDRKNKKLLCGRGLKNNFDGIPFLISEGTMNVNDNVLTTIMNIPQLQIEKEVNRLNKTKDPLMSSTKLRLESIANSDPEAIVIMKINLKKR